MTQIERRRFSKTEKTNLRKDFLGSAFNNYKDFAVMYHDKYNRTIPSIVMALSKMFRTKNEANVEKKKFINQALQEKAQMELELNTEIPVCPPPPEDLFVEQDVVEKDDIISLKGNITVSINCDIFTTQIVSKNVNISKNQIVIEL